MLTGAAMFRPISPNMIRPQQPLRKPLSTPAALCAAPPPRHLSMPDVTPVLAASDASGDSKSVFYSSDKQLTWMGVRYGTHLPLSDVIS